MGDPRLEALRRVLKGRTSATLAEAVSRRAAVAVVFRNETDPEILFIQRAEHPQDPWSGQIAFPGGRFEEADPDLRATAIRETGEETGIDLEEADYLGPLDEVRASGRLRPMDLSIRPFVFLLTKPVSPALSDEVTRIHWIPLATLLDEASSGTFFYGEGEGRLGFPCLQVEGISIWGLTYRMFMDLKALLGEPPR
jgi:8-oxo-dGTP pyrophosphatase MutT (NUDIX family)